jgi:hypothetical protein
MKRASFFAAEPGYCVFRAPQVECDPIPDIGGPRDGLDLLAVVPEGSGLGIEQELSSLNRVVKLVENLRISDLRGRVTPNAIQQRLGETQPNIFHFVGHGELDSTGGVTIRLNSEEGGQEEFWAQAEQFSSIFAKSSIRLAVLNCCYGGRSARTSLSGLGPLLLRRGVPAIVAMNYPIADSAAQSFSEFFYNALLKGENGGRVDIAIQHTRDTTFY